MPNTMIVSQSQGTMYFDAVFKVQHEKELALTSHPIQSGVSVTDHSFMEPEKVTLEIGYSDVMGSIGETNHSVNAFTKLETLMGEREPVTLVTRFKVYQDMIIVSMSVPDEMAFMFGMRATLTFQQVKFVYAQIVSVQKKVRSGKQQQDQTTDEQSLDEVVDNRSLLLIVLQDFLGIDPTQYSWYSKYSSTRTQQETKTDAATNGSGQQTDTKK